VVVVMTFSVPVSVSVSVSSSQSAGRDRLREGEEPGVGGGVGGVAAAGAGATGRRVVVGAGMGSAAGMGEREEETVKMLEGLVGLGFFAALALGAFRLVVFLPVLAGYGVVGSGVVRGVAAPSMAAAIELLVWRAIVVCFEMV
jgi:hypothetical protein